MGVLSQIWSMCYLKVECLSSTTPYRFVGLTDYIDSLSWVNIALWCGLTVLYVGKIKCHFPLALDIMSRGSTLRQSYTIIMFETFFPTFNFATTFKLSPYKESWYLFYPLKSLIIPILQSAGIVFSPPKCQWRPRFQHLTLKQYFLSINGNIAHFKHAILRVYLHTPG